MTPKSVEDFYNDWKNHHEKAVAFMADAQALLLQWMKDPVYDFSYFKLKADVHFGRRPCSIWGNAHDWIATYPDDSWEKKELISVRFDFAEMDKYNLMVELLYGNGDTNYAAIPLYALSSELSFAKWYNEQFNNYTANRKEIANELKEREKITQGEEFRKWLDAGNKFVKLGLVWVTGTGEFELERSTRKL